jgi:AAA15 family ATPase/GTPase
MLISFSVKNYRSFADNQTISLVASSASKKNHKISFPSGNSMAGNLLRSACIFGANGAGKSSLIKALGFFKYFVITSAKDLQEGESINVTPHLFKVDLDSKPSEFEIVFIYKQSYYQYGFALDEQRVYGEWLFTKPNTEKSRTRTLFQREYDSASDKYVWDINKTFIKGDKEIWKNSTRSNALFLSQAVQLNAADLKEPFEWIHKNLRIIDSPDRISSGFTARKCTDDIGKEKVLNLLKSVDLKIQDFKVDEVDIDLSELPHDMPQALKDALLEEIKGKKSKAYHIVSYHRNSSGKLVPLDMSDESDGTNVLFGMAGPWFDVLENGYTLVVDELHNSLHPHAFKTLVNLFHDPEINKNNAQLIFTSHETSVMNKDFMHKDQIWLAEKDEFDGTKLIPLSDFKIRDVTNFQKAYLDGRYGGVPEVKGFLNV